MSSPTRTQRRNEPPLVDTSQVRFTVSKQPEEKRDLATLLAVASPAAAAPVSAAPASTATLTVDTLPRAVAAAGGDHAAIWFVPQRGSNRRVQPACNRDGSLTSASLGANMPHGPNGAGASGIRTVVADSARRRVNPPRPRDRCSHDDLHRIWDSSLDSRKLARSSRRSGDWRPYETQWVELEKKIHHATIHGWNDRCHAFRWSKARRRNHCSSPPVDEIRTRDTSVFEADSPGVGSRYAARGPAGLDDEARSAGRGIVTTARSSRRRCGRRRASTG
jgi:hypothetical protein